MKNKKVITEIDRVREIMGISLLNEQTAQHTFHIWETCENGVVVAPYSNPAIFGQAVVSPNSWNGIYDPAMWAQESQSFYSQMGSPSQGQVVAFDTTTDTTSAFQDAYGKCLMYVGVSQCTYNPQTSGGGSGAFGPFDPGVCSVGFGGALYANWSHVLDCQDCTSCMNGTCNQTGAYECVNNNCIPQAGGTYSTANGYSSPLLDCQAACQPSIDDYECVNGQCVVQVGGSFNSGFSSQANENDCLANCSSTSPLDCLTGAPDWTPQQWTSVTAFMALADQKSLLAQSGGNGCNWICNKRDSLQSQAPFTPGTLGGDKKQCKLDYINDVYNNTPCQPNPQGSGCVFCGGVTPSQTFINNMTTMYNGTGGPSGCWGLNGNNPNSICGRKAQFCPAPAGNNSNPTPMQQAKCDWLTTFTVQNNCNC